MTQQRTQTIFHAFLYGGASVLLAFDLFFLAKALVQGAFVPLLPITAGILITIGLLLIVYAQQQAHEEDKREHRRLSRVATQLEHPLHVLQRDFSYVLEHAATLPPEVRLKVRNMETSSQVLLDNVRDVFLMLRAQDGKISQDVRILDMCEVIDEAVANVTSLASARNVKIEVKKHCKEAPVQSDKQLLIIALTHLLENAIYYTLTPGLTHVAVVKSASAVRVIVRDRGIGVREEDRDAVFRPFARGSKANQFDQQGIGVGLTLARLIAREGGGTVLYQNRPDSTGSEFELRLPISK